MLHLLYRTACIRLPCNRMSCCALLILLDCRFSIECNEHLDVLSPKSPFFLPISCSDTLRTLEQSFFLCKVIHLAIEPSISESIRPPNYEFILKRSQSNAPLLYLFTSLYLYIYYVTAKTKNGIRSKFLRKSQTNTYETLAPSATHVHVNTHIYTRFPSHEGAKAERENEKRRYEIEAINFTPGRETGSHQIWRKR